MGDGSVQVRTTGLRHDWTKSVEPYLSTVTPGFPSATPCMTRYACLGFGEDSVRQSGMHTGACMIRLAATDGGEFVGGASLPRCVRRGIFGGAPTLRGASTRPRRRPRDVTRIRWRISRRVASERAGGVVERRRRHTTKIRRKGLGLGSIKRRKGKCCKRAGGSAMRTVLKVEPGSTIF